MTKTEQTPPRTLCLILAAGEGTRMRSSRPKVLHEIANRSLVGHVLAAASALPSSITAVVVGPDRDDVSSEARSVAPDCAVHTQHDRLGTAHAVQAAIPSLETPGLEHVLVLFGDTPLIQTELLTNIVSILNEGADVCVVGFETTEPTGYGRLIVEDGALTGIVEEKDATDEQRKITLCNSGVMAFKAAVLRGLLGKISNDNAKGEYYLTDAVAIANQAQLDCRSVIADETLVQGINDRAQLADADRLMQLRLREAALKSGVTMHMPQTVYMSHDTLIGQDTVIEPNVIFGPGVSVGANCQIRGFSHLEKATLGNGVAIGPYARLRPGTELSDNVKVGNFVETKNAKVADGAKVNHLSYIGDAIVGANANIGAGTITCNYDGVSKHLTRIGEGAFIGSNSSLVAPITIEDGAYIGSGSVVTKPVPKGALGVGRARQRNIENWVSQRGPRKSG